MPRRIELLNTVLTKITKDNMSEFWALLQNFIAMSLYQNPLGNRADNLDESIERYKLALEVYTREAYPEDWATTKNNLAVASIDRIQGERADNLDESIERYKLALEVYTREAYPFEYIQTSVSLGKCYLETSKWEKVSKVCSGAEEAGEDIVTLAIEEEVQAKHLSMIQDAFSNHAYALAREGKYDSALEILEKGKTRSLNQALLYQRIRTASLTSDIHKQFTLLLQEIHNLQEQLKGEDRGGKTRYTEIAPELRKRQKELKKIFQTIKKELHLETLEEWKSENVLKKYKKMQTALVVINVTPVGTVLLVASPYKE